MKCFYCTEEATEVCPSCNSIGYCSPSHLELHQTKMGYCQPFTVQFNEEFGNYLTATKDIKPFDVVLEDVATAWGTYDDSNPLCLSCLKPADINTTCTYCNMPMCGAKECMEKSSIHSLECQILQRHQPDKIKVIGKHPVYALIAPLRIYQLKQFAIKGDDESKRKFERIISLESHLEKHKKGIVQ